MYSPIDPRSSATGRVAGAFTIPPNTNLFGWVTERAPGRRYAGSIPIFGIPFSRSEEEIALDFMLLGVEVVVAA